MTYVHLNKINYTFLRLDCEFTLRFTHVSIYKASVINANKMFLNLSC